MRYKLYPEQLESLARENTVVLRNYAQIPSVTPQPKGDDFMTKHGKYYLSAKPSSLATPILLGNDVLVSEAVVIDIAHLWNAESTGEDSQYQARDLCRRADSSYCEDSADFDYKSRLSSSSIHYD
jgi:hypothetical protein